MNAGDCFSPNTMKVPNTTVVLLGDGKARLARHSLGAFLGDQQVKYIYWEYSTYCAYLTYFAYLGIR